MNDTMLTEGQVFRKFTHFTAFLYFYMAFSDDFLDEKEAEMIVKKMQAQAVEGEDVAALYEEVMATYKATPPDALDELIQTNFEYFKHESQEYKYGLFTDLYDVMIADGVVHYKENESLDKLKNLVNTYLL